MIVIPKKATAPPAPSGIPTRVPVPEPPPMRPDPAPPVVVVDNSYIVALIQKQQDQIDAMARRWDTALVELAQAVQRLEPGQGFSVTVTGWNHQGRIQTLKIVKE